MTLWLSCQTASRAHAEFRPLPASSGFYTFVHCNNHTARAKHPNAAWLREHLGEGVASRTSAVKRVSEVGLIAAVGQFPVFAWLADSSMR